MYFSEILASITPTGNSQGEVAPAPAGSATETCTVKVTEDWTQGRAIFGGLMAAVATAHYADWSVRNGPYAVYKPPSLDLLRPAPGRCTRNCCAWVGQ